MRAQPEPELLADTKPGKAPVGAGHVEVKGCPAGAGAHEGCPMSAGAIEETRPLL